MVDIHTKEVRRRNMAAVGSRNTAPELKVRSLLHRLGFRFRLHRKDLPGSPDIVLPRHRTVIFVHGCFWHSHDCKHGRQAPEEHHEFWAKKRRDTTERDARACEALRALGWKVITIWECESKTGSINSWVESIGPPPIR
jgi:DNA mismatch endonuclease, patch repair protein